MSPSKSSASSAIAKQFPVLTLTEREKDLITRAFICGILKGEKRKKEKRKAYYRKGMIREQSNEIDNPPASERLQSDYF